MTGRSPHTHTHTPVRITPAPLLQTLLFSKEVAVTVTTIVTHEFFHNADVKKKEIHIQNFFNLFLSICGYY